MVTLSWNYTFAYICINIYAYIVQSVRRCIHSCIHELQDQMNADVCIFAVNLLSMRALLRVLFALFLYVVYKRISVLFRLIIISEFPYLLSLYAEAPAEMGAGVSSPKDVQYSVVVPNAETWGEFALLLCFLLSRLLVFSFFSIFSGWFALLNRMHLSRGRILLFSSTLAALGLLC